MLFESENDKFKVVLRVPDDTSERAYRGVHYFKNTYYLRVRTKVFNTNILFTLGRYMLISFTNKNQIKMTKTSKF